MPSNLHLTTAPNGGVSSCNTPRIRRRLCGPHGKVRRRGEMGARHHRPMCWEPRLCKKKLQQMSATGAGRAG